MNQQRENIVCIGKKNSISKEDNEYSNFRQINIDYGLF